MSHTPNIPKNGRTPEQNAWRAQCVQALADAGMTTEADAFEQCQNEESVRFYVVCPTDPDHETIALAETCHLRTCPECEARNGARLLQRYHDPIQAVYEHAPSEYRLRHVVLTTPVSLLQSDVKKQLRSAYEKLARFFDRLWGDDWKDTGKGWLAGAEFGPEGLKLHFHVLVLCDWIDQDRARDIWTDLTGYTAIPYIKAINAANYTLTDALSEIIKYTTKLSDLEPNLMPVLLAALKRTRRIRCQGAFYNLPQPEKEDKVCPECGAPLTLWHKSKFEYWKSGALGRSLESFDAAGLSELLLRLGNKSQGLDPPQPWLIPPEISFDGDGPPPRDFSNAKPPTWLDQTDAYCQ